MIGQRERLGIALVHGRLSMTVKSAGTVLRQLDHPQALDSSESLVKALDSMLGRLDFHGEDVSLVYASSRTLLVPVRHPAMGGKDLRLFLGRKAATEWKDKEPMVWGFTRLRGSKTEENSLLHLAPAKPLEAVVTWCRSHNMQPVLAVSTAGASIATLTEAPGTLRVVAVESADTTCLLVGRSTSEILLVRELAYSWNNELAGGAERVAREIQRTSLFVKQQWSTTIESVVLVGAGAGAMAGTAKEISGLDAVVAEGPMDWAGAALDLSPGRLENLFPSKVLGHKRRRRFSVSLLIVSFVFLAASIGAEVLLHFLIRKADWELESLALQEKTTKLLLERAELNLLLTSIQKDEALDQALRTRALPAVPAWFAARLADAIPDDMSLTQVDVQWDSTQTAWSVVVDGIVPREPMLAGQKLALLQSHLQAPVLGLQIVQPWRVSWIENLRSGGTWELPGMYKRFRLTGVFR